MVDPEYMSTLCRLGEHARCQEHPVVRCACRCHGPGHPCPTAGTAD